MADGHLIFDTKINEQGFNQGISKLRGLASKGMAVVGAAAAAGVAAFGMISKASLDSVASMEQNLGGVETLFKNNADAVIENAKRAYKTAGMSANDYMSNVTSFAASLLQSLGGDTQKAADIADVAMRDMSDNANKMGTSMELIQNAYQGFAKQNYTMLDNLKLGYGGTKTEMERLLADAQKLTGVKYDINNLSDVYSAIHVIQEELGITGTTAKEASSTIEGSVNAAKAAFDNILNGTIDAQEFADVFVIAADNVIKNISAIVPRLAQTIPEVAKSVYEHFSSSFSNIGTVGLDIIESILTNIVNNAPRLLESGANMIANLINGIGSRLPELLPLAVSAILAFVSGLLSNVPKLLQAGADLLLSLANGIANSLPIIIEQAPRIINDFCSGLYQQLPLLITTGLGIILSLVSGIIQAVPTLLANAGEIVKAIINVFTLVNLFNAGACLIKGLCSGIKSMFGSIGSTVKSLLNKIKNPFNINWGSIGTNIVQGIANGIKNGVSAIISAAKTAAQSALKAAKSALDIHSPSRVFRDQVGKMMALGIGVGFEKNIPIKSMNTNLQHAVDSLRKDVVISTSATGGGTVGGIRSIPGFEPNSGSIDYKKLKQAQKEALNEANKKPVILNGREIDRATKGQRGGLVFA